MADALVIRRLPIKLSLSARRAWIEILAPGPAHHHRGVALRKESVDRNIHSLSHANDGWKSLSARRAWIEILVGCPQGRWKPSLSARRAWIEIILSR